MKACSSSIKITCTIHIGMSEAENFELGTRIKVIGIGSGGSHAINHLIECGMRGVEFICTHSGAQALPSSRAHRTIELCRAPVEHVHAALAGTDLLFITAGRGGGADLEAAVAIARAAREMDILTVGLAATPREDTALAKLEAHVDSLIVTNDGALHGMLKTVVSEIAAILNEYGHVNVDFTDVSTVMRGPGRAMAGSAQASGPHRARIAAEHAVEGLDLSDAKALLVLVTAAKGSLKLSESRQAMAAINAGSSPSAHVIFGAAFDESLGDSIRVTVVATGVARQQH